MPTYSTRPAVPVDALRLNEDIRALEQARKLVDWIDPYNVADDPAKGRKILRYVTGQLKIAERYAEAKMRREYLDPRKKILKKNERKAGRAV